MALLAASAALQAQVYELHAGASTLYDAQGVTLKMHALDFDSSIGAGLLNGHFSAGGQATRQRGDVRMTIGQQYIPLNLPTDVFDSGQVFTGIGYGYKSTLHADRHLMIFGGLTSADGGTPLFAANNISYTPAALLLWKRHVGHGITATTSLMASRKPTAIESLGWKPSQHSYAAVSAGVGSNAPYGAASFAMERSDLQILAEYVSAGRGFRRLINPTLLLPPEPVRENISLRYRFNRFVSASASRQNYRVSLFDSQPSSISTANSAAVELGTGRTGTGLSIYQSSYSGHSNTSLSLTGYREQGPLRLTAGILHSKPSVGEATSILLGTAAYRLTSRLRVTESVTRSSGSTSFAHGGELQWTFGSIRVDHQLFYLPTQPDNPFQQAVVFDVQQRVLPKLAVHVASFISSSGKIQYTFEAGTVFGPSYRDPVNRGLIGLQVIIGRVVDTSGQPVEGAALLLGTQQIYTDSKGSFLVRLPKPKSLPVRVLTDEFLSGGTYSVVEAPSNIASMDEDHAPVQRIVVRRLANGGVRAGY